MEKIFDYIEIAQGLKEAYQDMLFNATYCSDCLASENGEMELNDSFVDMVGIGKNAIIYYLKQIIFTKLESDNVERLYSSVSEERNISRLVKDAVVIDEKFYTNINLFIDELDKNLCDESDSLDLEDEPETRDNTSEVIREFLFNELIDLDFNTLLDFYDEEVTTESEDYEYLEETLLNINDVLSLLDRYVKSSSLVEGKEINVLKTDRFEETSASIKNFLKTEGNHITKIEDIEGLNMYMVSLDVDDEPCSPVHTTEANLVYDEEFKQIFVAIDFFNPKNESQYKVECGYDEINDEIFFDIYKNLEAVCQIGSNTKGFLLGTYFDYFRDSAEDADEFSLFVYAYFKVRVALDQANGELLNLGIGTFEDLGII